MISTNPMIYGMNTQGATLVEIGDQPDHPAGGEPRERAGEEPAQPVVLAPPLPRAIIGGQTVLAVAWPLRWRRPPAGARVLAVARRSMEVCDIATAWHTSTVNCALQRRLRPHSYRVPVAE